MLSILNGEFRSRATHHHYAICAEYVNHLHDGHHSFQPPSNFSARFRLVSASARVAEISTSPFPVGTLAIGYLRIPSFAPSIDIPALKDSAVNPIGYDKPMLPLDEFSVSGGYLVWPPDGRTRQYQRELHGP